jgi:hypothetical protein
LAWLRQGTRYNELTGACAFDGAIREVDMVERQAARLVDLARRSFREMAATCKAEKHPLFANATSGRKPIVELALQFGLLPERTRSLGLVAFGGSYEKADVELAHDLINPLLYFDKAAAVLKNGFVRARSGQELRVDEAVALFENYLGIARRNAEVAADVKSLNAGRPEQRVWRSHNSLSFVLAPLLKHLTETLNYPPNNDLRKYFSKDCGFHTIEIKKNSEIIKQIIFSADALTRAGVPRVRDPDMQMMIRRYARMKRPPDVNQFIAEFIARKTDRPERDRALAAARKRRSRLKQSAKLRDDTV